MAPKRTKPASSVADLAQRYTLNPRPNKETSIERMIRQALDMRGVAYTAQGRVGRFRPDFILHELRGIIECDGPIHRTARQKVKDRRKDAAYAVSGYTVIRFSDEQIKRSPIGCVDQAIALFRGLSPAP